MIFCRLATVTEHINFPKAKETKKKLRVRLERLQYRDVLILLNKRVTGNVEFSYTRSTVSSKNAFEISNDPSQPNLEVSLNFFQVVLDQIQ